MFRDDAQAALAIRALLGTLGLEHLWTSSGPGPSALSLNRELESTLSPAQNVLLDAAWALWSFTAPARVRFDEVVRVLDRRSCEALLSLVLAYLDGPGAVDVWLASGVRGEVPSHPGDALPGSTGSSTELDQLGNDWPTLDMLSLRYIQVVVECQQGNRARAAEVLGIDPRTLSRILAKMRRGRVPSMQTRCC